MNAETKLSPMTLPTELTPDDWRRICDALRYLGRDLHHRSFAVSAERRELLWEEMDRAWPWRSGWPRSSSPAGVIPPGGEGNHDPRREAELADGSPSPAAQSTHNRLGQDSLCLDGDLYCARRLGNCLLRKLSRKSW